MPGRQFQGERRPARPTLGNYRALYPLFHTKQARVQMNDTRLSEAKYVLVIPSADRSNLYYLNEPQRCLFGGYAAKLEPHPHVFIAFGLLNVNPRAFRPS